MNSHSGKTLGSFVVEEDLGSGGMGDLLLGTQPSLQRPVVIKKLRRDLANDDAYVERFRREACIAAAIHHQNVVAVYDCFSHRGSHFIALEYVDGLDLERVIERKGMVPPHMASLIMLEVLRGMEAIHARGMVHRDIKPGNLLLGRDGAVKVTDFGIALDPTGSPLTQPGYAIGTPPYMAPEQLQGQRVDVRSDIFCLGMVLYEMLAGTTPFSVPDSEADQTLVDQMRNEDYTPLEDAAPSTPRHLRRLVNACLKAKPHKRPDSVGAMRASLEKSLGRPTTTDARNLIADWLWGASLFELREGETVISRGMPETQSGMRTRLRWVSAGFAAATVVLLLAVVLLQQRSILQEQQRELLDEITAALPKEWPTLPPEFADTARLFGGGEQEPARLSFATEAGTLIYLDGEVLAESSLGDTLSMVSGVYTVAFEHPELGRYEEEIELGAGEQRLVVAAFDRAESESGSR